MSVDYAEVARLVRKGRRAEKRGKAVERFIVGVLTQILAAFIGGFFLMLGVDFLNAAWWDQLPTMGYWTAVLTVGLLRGVFSRITTTEAKS
jgi:hypothetical protein